MRLKEIQKMPYIEPSQVEQRLSSIKHLISQNRRNLEQFYRNMSVGAITDHSGFQLSAELPRS